MSDGFIEGNGTGVAALGNGKYYVFTGKFKNGIANGNCTVTLATAKIDGDGTFFPTATKKENVASYFVSDFVNGYAQYSKDNKWGFINKNASIIVNPTYKKIVSSFGSDGYAVVMNDKDKEIKLDKNGKEAGYSDHQLAISKQKAEAERLAEQKKIDSKEIIVVTVNGISFKMIRVEGASFDMGREYHPPLPGFHRDNVYHRVTLSTYYIGETEVTQELWKAVMGRNPSRFVSPKRPVESVSYGNCKDFIEKLNEMTGLNFRLPTEAEWEFAACGGWLSNHYYYSGSDVADVVGWADLKSHNILGKENPNFCTHEVKTKKPNELGIYDMTGNVWEWCSDWYGDYPTTNQTNPRGPETPPDSLLLKVKRGGCYGGISVKNIDRGNESMRTKDDGLGLRLVLTP